MHMNFSDIIMKPKAIDNSLSHWLNNYSNKEIGLDIY